MTEVVVFLALTFMLWPFVYIAARKFLMRGVERRG